MLFMLSTMRDLPVANMVSTTTRTLPSRFGQATYPKSASISLMSWPFLATPIKPTSAFEKMERKPFANGPAALNTDISTI